MTENVEPKRPQREPSVMAQTGYIASEAPILLSYIAALSGSVPPDPSGEFSFCELGCGEATTLLTLAAANPQARFFGVDDRATELDKARELAEAAELSGVELHESAFTAVGDLELPELDYISIPHHYSRLKADELEQVFAFVQKRLKPGGLFYVDYLALPGNGPMIELWRVWDDLAKGLEGHSDEPELAALDCLERLRQAGFNFFKANPLGANLVQNYAKLRETRGEALKAMVQQVLSTARKPQSFVDIARDLAPFGLTYAGSTELTVNDLSLAVPAEHHGLFEGLEDVGAIETLKDTIRFQKRRRDVFVKDVERNQAAATDFLNRKLVLVSQGAGASMQRSVPLPGGGKVTFSEPLYQAILSALDRGAKCLADLYEAPEVADFTADQVRSAATRLLASNQCQLALDGAVRAPVRILTGDLEFCGAYNKNRVKYAADQFKPVALASTLTGRATVALSPMEAIFLDLLTTLGPENVATAVQGRLKDSEYSIKLGDKMVAASELGTEALQKAFSRFRAGKLQSLFRFAILEASTPALSLEGADDGFEFK